jgi:precorrin-6Y C5,15-methyltransferase (decarboxylating)
MAEPPPVTVIGVGADGRPAQPLPAGTTPVAGGRRQLAAHAPPGVATVAIGGDLDAAVAAVAAARGPVAVLASGDPGWFGFVRRLSAALGRRRLVVHPAPSSVAYVFARLGMAWEDAVVVSAHGRCPRAAVAAALAHPKVAVLTAPDTPPAALARTLRAAGCPDRRVVIAARLGHQRDRAGDGGEQWHDTDLATAAELTTPDPAVLVLLDPARPPGSATVVGHTAPPRAWARPAAAYAHRDGQVTKPAVRALALAHLAPGTGRLLWDVGCGSGSVAVEAALLGAGVVALDRDPDQLARVRENASAARVGLGVVAGSAPDALAGLPDPDAVFVGGGGGALPAVLDAVLDRRPDRVAIALATVERTGPVLARLAAAGWPAGAQLVQVSDLVPLGDGHRLAPQNPVLLVLGERP